MKSLLLAISCLCFFATVTCDAPLMLLPAFVGLFGCWGLCIGDRLFVSKS